MARAYNRVRAGLGFSPACACVPSDPTKPRPIGARFLKTSAEMAGRALSPRARPSRLSTATPVMRQARCPLWVKSRHVQRTRLCPLYPPKRHSISEMALAFCWPIVHFLIWEVLWGCCHEERIYSWRCGAGCFLCICTGRLCSARWLSRRCSCAQSETTRTRAPDTVDWPAQISLLPVR